MSGGMNDSCIGTNCWRGLNYGQVEAEGWMHFASRQDFGIKIIRPTSIPNIESKQSIYPPPLQPAQSNSLHNTSSSHLSTRVRARPRDRHTTTSVLGTMQTLAQRLASFEVYHPAAKKRTSSTKNAKFLRWPHKTPRPAQVGQSCLQRRCRC